MTFLKLVVFRGSYSGGVSPGAVTVFCGIPAAGKSQFVRALQKTHGYSYFTLNGEDDEWRVELCQRDAYSAYRRGDVPELLSAVWSAPPPAAVEYGFPPDRANLAIVQKLRAAGAHFVWFDCPFDIARKRYAKRERNRPAAMIAFKRQIDLITEKYEDIVRIADPQIVSVVRGKAPRSHAELYDEIFDTAGIAAA